MEKQHGGAWPKKAKEALGRKITSASKLPYIPGDCVGEGRSLEKDQTWKQLLVIKFLS